MNQPNEEAAEARSRFEIFRSIYPKEDINNLTPGFFFLNSFQLSGFHRIIYEKYCQNLQQVEVRKKLSLEKKLETE